MKPGLAAVALLAAASIAAAAIPGEVAPFLPPPGTHEARAMQIMVPVEIARIGERMVEAAQRNPDWFRAYIAAHPDERPLPYHPNIGVSEAEYRRFVGREGRGLLFEAARIPLTVAATPDGGFAFSASGPAALLDGIVLYPERDLVETPLGRLDRRVPIDQDDGDAPTGRWTGVQWSNEGAPGPRVKLAIGRRENGERVIYYDVAPGEGQTVFLLYAPR